MRNNSSFISLGLRQKKSPTTTPSNSLLAYKNPPYYIIQLGIYNPKRHVKPMIVAAAEVKPVSMGFDKKLL